VSFVRSILLKAEIFWNIPSSFSGKYHPQDEHGPGGNVLHTKRVVRIADILSESYALSDDEKNVVIAACLLHDVTKGIMDNSDELSFQYDPMHPYTVAKFVSNCQMYDKEYGNDSQSSSLFISEESIQTILRLVRCHLGPWSPVPETYPITYLDYIVHIADNIASKLHNIIEDSDLINEKWRKQPE
ncbi:MAG: HD domain-containing protein, partial [Proteobacteria bacterium]|nr:HD domain-containing protein [Pseudomonadota bacterium]